MFLSCFLNINVSLCCFKSLTTCGYGEQQVPLRFDSTSVSLQKLAHLQIGESGRRGKAGVEKLVGEYLYACQQFFRGIQLYLPLSLHLPTYTSKSQLSTHFAVVGKIYSFSRGFPLPPPSLYLSLFHPALPDIHFSQLPWILHGTPRSLARSTFALYPLFSPGGTRRTTKLTDSDCHSSSSSLPSIRVQTECV